MSAKHQVDDIRAAQHGKISTFVRGHELIREGAPHLCSKPVDGCFEIMTGYPKWDNGHGKCSCGALSDPLPSNNARKAWHRQHKLDVLAERTS